MIAAAKQQRLSQSEIEYIREQERQKQLKLLKKKKNRAAELRRDRAAMMLLVIGIFTLCFSYVIIEAKIYNCGYQINEIKSEISKTQAKAERLSLEVEGLSSMERIAPYAIANLEMIYPATSNVKYIDYQIINNNAALMAAADISIEVIDIGQNGKRGYIPPFFEALERLVSEFYSSAAIAAKK